MRRKSIVNEWVEKNKILRKRPMCWAAIGFLLIILIFLLGRSYKTVLEQKKPDGVFLEGTITEKQYKKTSYGGSWEIILKEAKMCPQQELGKFNEEQPIKGNLFLKEKDLVIEKLEGKYLCEISSMKKGDLKIGQRILLEASYVSWEVSTNPGQFDAGKYYCSLGILGQFKKCKVLWQGSSYSVFWEKMWQFRQETQDFFQQELGEKDGAIISAMLLGEKSGLNEEYKNLYQRNGISHILAISGLHFMLLGSGMVKVLKVILGGSKRASFSTMILMLLYCVFTGNSISTIRAAIMFALSLIAEMLGRSYDSLSALGVAAILQLFINPYVLNYSGFWLSFLAVIGVTFLAPVLQEIFRANRKIGKSLCVSLSASIATLPVLLKNYGTYPWYSLFLNLLILPFMAVLLFLSVGLTVIGWMVAWISQAGGKWMVGTGTIAVGFSTAESLILGLKKVVVIGIKGILAYFEICCKIFENIGFQDGYLGSPAGGQIIIYVCLIGLAISKIIKHSAFGRKMILLSAVSILTGNIYFGTEVTMLDVGQGDSIVIRNENGNIYISDCGSTSVSKVGKYRLISFLKYKGYGKIKGIFISHLDEDHINGVIELLEMAMEEKIEIQYLFLPSSVLGIEEDWKIVEELQYLTKSNTMQMVYLTQGDKITDGSLEFVCFYPKADKEVKEAINAGKYPLEDRKAENSSGKDRNNQSLVLYLKYRDFDMLLTGDIEKSGEMEIASYIDRMSLDVLKVAHHGSSGSSCEELLERLNPKLSLISCGKNNKSTMGSIQFNDTNSVKMA